MTTGQPIKIETRADKGKMITGYAAVFYRAANPGTQYELMSDMYERIDRSAFNRALSEKDDARALFNHDPNFLLGRASAGTLRLSVDDIGLRYENDLPDTQVGRDLATSIERGDLTGSSFGFRVKSQTWTEEEGRDIRTINEVELFDVGPVTYPAYDATTTGLRSEELAEVRSKRDEWKKAQKPAPTLLSQAEAKQRIAKLW